MNKMLWAIEHMEAEIRGKSASRAIAIVNGMADCLDLQQGGELAQNLLSVYVFIARDLLRANYESDEDAVLEAVDIIKNIKESWDKMPQSQREAVKTEPSAMPNASVETQQVDAKPAIRKPALGLRQLAIYS